MVCSWLCAGLLGELREVTTATSVLCKMGLVILCPYVQAARATEGEQGWR